jgi:GNAT superfamily N-acetyltransferase
MKPDAIKSEKIKPETMKPERIEPETTESEATKSKTKSRVETVTADYHNPRHAADIVRLLNAYALDPMGGGKSLPVSVTAILVSELAKRPYAFTVIAYVDDTAVGLINCFEAFSTFAARPLINIHDVVVDKPWRGHGISQLMLDKVEAMAIQKGCCKLTLEILQGNKTAGNAYQKFGFSAYSLDPQMGDAVFWQKWLIQ